MDYLTPEQRSNQMRLVRSLNTKPEMRVRKLVHALGYRYRLHRADLPGTPDLVFTSRRKIIFVHGCFWHGHSCRLGRVPKSKLDYWLNKIDTNRKRDAKVMRNLRKLNWKCLVVWECCLDDEQLLARKIKRFLN